MIFGAEGEEEKRSFLGDAEHNDWMRNIDAEIFDTCTALCFEFRCARTREAEVSPACLFPMCCFVSLH